MPLQSRTNDIKNNTRKKRHSVRKFTGQNPTPRKKRHKRRQKGNTWKHHFIRNLQEKCRYQQKSGTSDKKESGTSDAKKSGTSERLTAYARLQLPHLLPQGTTLLADEVSYCTWPELGIVGCQRVDRCLVTAKVRSSSCTAKVEPHFLAWEMELGGRQISYTTTVA